MCSTEHDYDIDWKLVTFNSTVNQICPRKAQGNDVIRFFAIHPLWSYLISLDHSLVGTIQG